MGFRVTFKGLEISCDTVDDLMAVVETLLNITGNRDSILPVRVEHLPADFAGASRWTSDRFGRFIGLVKGKQKRLLKLLMDNPDGVTDEVIRREFGLKSNNALAGVVTGIVRNAKKVGIGSSEVYTKSRVQIGEAMAFEYRPVPAFVDIARQYGWPKKASPSVSELYARKD